MPGKFLIFLLFFFHSFLFSIGLEPSLKQLLFFAKLSLDGFLLEHFDLNIPATFPRLSSNFLSFSSFSHSEIKPIAKIKR